MQATSGKTVEYEKYVFYNHLTWQIQVSEEYSVEVAGVHEGDKIDVMLSYKTNTVYFFNNGVLQGITHLHSPYSIQDGFALLNGL